MITARLLRKNTPVQFPSINQQNENPNTPRLTTNTVRLSRRVTSPLTHPHRPGRDDPQGDAEDQQHRPGADGHEGFHDEACVEMHLKHTHTHR